MAGELSGAVEASINQWNQTQGASWTKGTAWSSVSTDFLTYVNNNFFPTLTETIQNLPKIGNPFQWLARMKVIVGQYRQEFAAIDRVPTGINLNTDGALLLNPEYPRVKTMVYQNGFRRKIKYTIDLSGDIQQNFTTLEDGINYVIGEYVNSLNSINITEYREMFGAIVDYCHNNLTVYQKKTVTSLDEAITKTFETMQALQAPTSGYNEGMTASGPAVGRLTRKTPLNRMMILCTNAARTHLLDTRIANTFQVAGLDITDHIISFPKISETPAMDGVYKVLESSDPDNKTVVTITEDDSIAYLHAMGMYNVRKNTTFLEGTVFTFDVSTLKEFKDKVVQIGLEDDNDIIIIDTASIMYDQDTSNFVTQFVNPEIDGVSYYLKYTSTKNISPFTNKAIIASEPKP